MTLVASDAAKLQLDGQTVSGITRRWLSLSRTLTDRTHDASSGWADYSSLEAPAKADLRAEGLFLSTAAMDSVRSIFLSGSAAPWSLVLPGDGVWAGQFYLNTLQFSGAAEAELTFSLRLVSTGQLSFQKETSL